MRFTKGLSVLLLPDMKEKTDEELANEEVGGVEEVLSRQQFFRKS